MHIQLHFFNTMFALKMWQFSIICDMFFFQIKIVYVEKHFNAFKIVFVSINSDLLFR